jgi:hypothetical protein
MAKKLPSSKYDKFGTLLAVEDCVLFVGFNKGLDVGTIVKFTAKMVTINSLDSKRKWGNSNVNKYAKDLVKADPAMVTMYLLKKEN